MSADEPAETSQIVVRRGGAQDVRFLRDMLHHAYYWKERAPDAGPGPVALYVKAWGRVGDTAVIALDRGFPVGAAWYRLFEEDKPGYGFVDEKTPELSIAVVPLHRRKGIGEAVLRSCMVQAREEGFQALSLSVAVHNRSRMMYQKAGFEKVAESGDGGDHWTMVANL